MPSKRKQKNQAKTPRRAVFVDRDGVLNEEVNYLGKAEDLRMIAGAAAAVKRLRGAGFKVIVISNQAGVARGFFTDSDLKAVTDRLNEELRAAGTRVDAIYYCTHHPDAGEKVRCECRKPGTAMLKQAEKRFHLDFKLSFFIGDTTTDIQTARNAGCVSVLVKTGKAGQDACYPDARADFECADMPAAADWIISRRRASA